jgi:hypothetical protein
MFISAPWDCHNLTLVQKKISVLFCSSNASYSDWSSEFGHCKSSKENEGAYLTLNAQPTPRMKQQPPALPSIHLPEFGDFGVMQSQASGVCLAIF